MKAGIKKCEIQTITDKIFETLRAVGSFSPFPLFQYWLFELPCIF